MKLFVIYDHPTDFPDKFVLRVWIVDFANDGQVRPLSVHFLSETLEGVRQYVPRGMINAGRKDDDDPKIKEVWL
jgi:hypothetical protein